MAISSKNHVKEQKNKSSVDSKKEPIVITTAKIPKTLHKRMKQQALDEDTTTKVIIIKALEQYLNKK